MGSGAWLRSSRQYCWLWGVMGKGNTCQDSFETKEQHIEENQPVVGTNRIEPFPVFRQPQIKCISHLATTENKLKWFSFHKWLILIAYLMRCWPDFPSALMQTHMTYSPFVHVLSVMLYFYHSSRISSVFELQSRCSTEFMDHDLPSIPHSTVHQSWWSNPIKRRVVCPQVCGQSILEEWQHNKDYQLAFTISPAWSVWTRVMPAHSFGPAVGPLVFGDEAAHTHLCTHTHRNMSAHTKSQK